MSRPHHSAATFGRYPRLLPGCLLLWALGSAPAGHSQGLVEDRPNVLLITIDTLRPDALGWVSGVDTTPVLDALAAEGAAFAKAVAPAPLTLPAHVSMFSGLLPRRHGVRDNHQVVGQAPPLLAERLAVAGYSTAAVVSGFPLTTQFGISRGFSRYDDRMTAGEGAWLERPALETSSVALSWLEDLPEPWFLWVHYYDPHFPYEPPSGFNRSGRRGGYDGEVASVDHQIGRLVAALPKPASATLTVVTGDHGEALGQHGEGTHGFFVYDETMLVPLLFHWPGRLQPLQSPAQPRLIDLAPTVLDLLGLPQLLDGDGVSLAPLLAGKALEVPPAYVETLQPWHSYGWAPLAAVRTSEWKLIAAPAPELYDLRADPAETANLFGQGRPQELTLRRELRALEALPAISSAAVADPDALARLRALGYLGTPESGPIPDRASLADPKDQLALRQLLTTADEALRSGRATEAVTALRRVLAQDPGNRFAQTRLGLALLSLGRPEEALVALREAVRLAPEDPEARAALAGLLTQGGDPAAAVGHWLELVRLQPQRAGGWSNLGAALGRSGEVERAATAYQRAAELEPEDPIRWIRLAFASFAAGRTTASIDFFLQASTLTSAEDFPHAGTLGLLLARQDRASEAVTWLSRSHATEPDFLEARMAHIRLLLTAGEADEARRLLDEGIGLRPELAQLVADDPALQGLLP